MQRISLAIVGMWLALLGVGHAQITGSSITIQSPSCVTQPYSSLLAYTYNFGIPLLCWDTTAKSLYYWNGATTGTIFTAVSSGSGGSAFTTPVTVNLTGGTLPASPTGTLVTGANAAGTSARDSEIATAASAFFSAIRYDGTIALPTAVQSGDQLGGYNSWGYNGSGLLGPLAAFRTYANQNFTTSAGGTYADIATTPNGSTTEAQVIKFENDAGMDTPGVTGGDKGAGTLNAAGLYVSGVAVGTGTVTSITCGTGLTCSTNPITTSGTITPAATSNPVYNHSLSGGTTSTMAINSATVAATDNQWVLPTANHTTTFPTTAQMVSGEDIWEYFITTGTAYTETFSTTGTGLTLADSVLGDTTSSLGSTCTVPATGGVWYHFVYQNNADIATTLTLKGCGPWPSASSLSTSLGGTGLTALTQYDLMAGNGTSAVDLISPGSTAGYVLTSNGASAYPTFQAAASGTAFLSASGLSINNLGTVTTNQTCNFATAPICEMKANSGITLTFSGGVAKQTYAVLFDSGGTGLQGISWPSNAVGMNTFQLSIGGGLGSPASLWEFYYDGTNYWYLNSGPYLQSQYEYLANGGESHGAWQMVNNTQLYFHPNGATTPTVTCSGGGTSTVKSGNSQCTGSKAPWQCCTASTTGTCSGSVDNIGEFQTSGTVTNTSCTMTFANTWSDAPECSFWDAGGDNTPVTYAMGVNTTTTVVVDFASQASSAHVIGYHCF